MVVVVAAEAAANTAAAKPTEIFNKTGIRHLADVRFFLIEIPPSRHLMRGRFMIPE
jgi:hypothetical protein